MTLGLSTVGFNLCQFSKVNDVKDLVPGIGSYVYSEGYAKTFWWCIWRLVEKLSKRSIIKSKVLASIEKTHKSYLKHIKMIEEDVNRFNRNAKRKATGQKISHDEAKKAKVSKEHIVEWHTWMNLTFHRHLIPNADKVKRVLNQIDPNIDNVKLLVDSYNIDCLTSRPMSVIRLESNMGYNFPYHLFKKLLKNEFSQSLKDWVEKLEKVQNANRKLHLALHSFFSPNEVAYIEYKLIEKTKTEICTQPDTVQVEWREELKKSKKISFPDKRNIKTIHLDKLLGDKSKSNFHHTYTIKGDSSHVVVVPANCLSAGIVETLYKITNCPVPERLEVDYIDHEGRFVLMKRFGKNFHEYDWTSGKKLVKEDKEMADKVVTLVDESINYDYTPKDLVPRFLLYQSSHKQLKTYRVFQRESFNFIEMEEFIGMCSGDNELVYDYILQESKLLKHFQAALVKKLIERVLNDDPDVDKLFRVHNISEAGFRKSAKGLEEEIERFVQGCKRSIRLKSKRKISNLDGVIKAEILKDRGTDFYHFRVDDGYKKKIVNRVLKFHG